MRYGRFISHFSQCNKHGVGGTMKWRFKKRWEVWERPWRVAVLAILMYFFQTEGTRGRRLIVTRCERLCVFHGVSLSGGLIGSWEQRVADMAMFEARVTRPSFLFIAVPFSFYRAHRGRVRRVLLRV
jgi:hypothetical protein